MLKIKIILLNDVFAPAVKKRKADNTISGPILLLLDYNNCPTHLSADSLSQREDIHVMFIPLINLAM